jgi:YD repeat-containing protein
MVKRLIGVALTIVLVVSMQFTTLARDILLDGGLLISSEVTLNNEPIGINALRIEDNSNLLFNLYFMNSEVSQRNIRVILAIYNGESKLKEIRTADGIAYQGDELNLSLTYVFSDEESDINGKLLIWDTFNNIRPLTAEIDFHKNTIYFYDANNRLLMVQKVNGEKIHFTYDDNGNLLSKQFEY